MCKQCVTAKAERGKRKNKARFGRHLATDRTRLVRVQFDCRIRDRKKRSSLLSLSLSLPHAHPRVSGVARLGSSAERAGSSFSGEHSCRRKTAELGNPAESPTLRLSLHSFCRSFQASWHAEKEQPKQQGSSVAGRLDTYSTVPMQPSSEWLFAEMGLTQTIDYCTEVQFSSALLLSLQ